MNNIESVNRNKFFPNAKASNSKANALKKSTLNRNGFDRKKEIDSNTKNDAKVQINDAIKDFARIKKAVDSTPDTDNSAKIAKLKAQVQNGTYKVDYDKLADKILSEEF